MSLDDVLERKPGICSGSDSGVGLMGLGGGGFSDTVIVPLLFFLLVNVIVHRFTTRSFSHPRIFCGTYHINYRVRSSEF